MRGRVAAGVRSREGPDDLVLARIEGYLVVGVGHVHGSGAGVLCRHAGRGNVLATLKGEVGGQTGEDRGILVHHRHALDGLAEVAAGVDGRVGSDQSVVVCASTVHCRHLEGQGHAAAVVGSRGLREGVVVSAADGRVGRHAGDDRSRRIDNGVGRRGGVHVATSILGVPRAHQRTGVSAAGDGHFVTVANGHAVAVVHGHGLVGRQGITALERGVSRHIREDRGLFVHHMDHV